ncbi:hypothetical protein [Actinomyces oricola]
MSAQAREPRTGQEVARDLGKDLPALSEGTWTCQTDGDATLKGVLEALPGGDWTGLAETTRGSKVVSRADAETLTESGGSSIEVGTVYELRLWRPLSGARGGDTAGDDGVAAHEVRWLNGSGSAQIRLYVDGGPEALGERCWWRTNSYLQHQGAGRKGPAQRMTSLEVFIEEPRFGNTVFADELFTGRWG